MRFDPSTLFAACICLFTAVGTASAAEIRLYEGPGFQGRNMVLRGEVDNLDRSGFNDRTSSIVVREGVWFASTPTSRVAHTLAAWGISAVRQPLRPQHNVAAGRRGGSVGRAGSRSGAAPKAGLATGAVHRPFCSRGRISAVVHSQCAAV